MGAPKLVKDILYPGQRGREIDRWEDHDGIKFPIRKTSAKRSIPPLGNWSDEDQSRFDELEEIINRIDGKPLAANKAAETKRKEQRGIYHDELVSLQEKREAVTRWGGSADISMLTRA